MNIASRIAAWAGTSGWKNPYGDDYVMLFDGEWNSGVGGIHDASTTDWTDLIGGYKLIPSNFVWGDKYIDSPDHTSLMSSVGYIGDPFYAINLSQKSTVEIVIDGTKRSKRPSFDFCQNYIGSTTLFADVGNYGSFYSGSGIMKCKSFLGLDSGVNTFAWVWDGSNLTIFKNGVQVATTTTTIISASAESYASRGMTIQTINPLYGVRVSDTAFTTERLLANYAIDRERFNLPT